jgi:hypothetical protein
MTSGAKAIYHYEGAARRASAQQEKFENWARTEYGLTDDDLKKPYDGRYFWERTADLWEAWKGSQDVSTGWLIKMTHMPRTMWLRADGSAADDPADALRFVRERDASAFLAVFLSAKMGDDVVSIYKRRLGADCYVVTSDA